MDPSMEGGSSLDVVVVDDEPGVRKLVRTLLERDDGFRVVAEAADAGEALALVSELQPAVVLLDLRMPGGDGRATLPQLVARAPRTMVVVLTAVAADVARDTSLAAGAFAYLEKTRIDDDLPTRLRLLYERFGRALDGATVLAPESFLAAP